MIAASSASASPLYGPLQSLGPLIVKLRKNHEQAVRHQRGVESELEVRGRELDQREQTLRERLAGEAEQRVANVKEELGARLDAAAEEAQRTRVELCAERDAERERAEKAERQTEEDQDLIEVLRGLLKDAEEEARQRGLRARALAGELAGATRAVRPCYRSWLEFPDRVFEELLSVVGGALAGGECRAEILAAPVGSTDLPWRDGAIMLRHAEVSEARIIEVTQLAPLPVSLTAQRRTSVTVWETHGRTGVLVQVSLLNALPKLDGAQLIDIAERLTEVARPAPDAQWLLATRAGLVDAAGLEDFLSFLRDPERARSVLVLASGLPNPDRLAAELFGAAHVVRLDRAAISGLSGRVGPELSVRAGELRCYRPGFGLDSPSGKHPLLTKSELSEGSSEELHQTLVLLAAAPMGLPVSLAVAADLAHLAPGEISSVPGQSLEELQQRLETLEAEKAALHKSIEGQSHTAKTQADGLPESEPPASVLDATVRAQADAKYLLFAPRALKTAAESPFLRPQDIYEKLMILDQLAAEYAAGAMGVGLGERAFELGLNWRSGVSDTAKRRFAKEYTFTYEGHALQLGPHIVVGNAAAADLCARIYLYASEGTDDLPRGFIVGHVGRHLPDQTT